MQRRNGSDDMETVCAIALELIDQTKLPVQVPLHGLTWIISALVGAAITVAARDGEVCFPRLQRSTLINPAPRASFKQKYRFICQRLQILGREACQQTASAGQHIALCHGQIFQCLR